MKWFLWVEPSSRMLQRWLELTWTPNLYGFLPCKSLEVTYGSVKIIFETKINCFAFSEPKKHHFVCKTRRMSNNFSDRITSAHAIISCCQGKYQNQNDFRAVSEHFRRLIYLFIYLFSFFPDGRGTLSTTGFPNYSRPFVGEEVTFHNTGISLLLSTSVWVLLSPPIECRETRPTA